MQQPTEQPAADLGRKYVKFELGVPTRVTLAYERGVNVPGKFGPQVMWSTSDNRRFYLPPLADEALMLQKPRTGETFTVVKSAGKGRQNDWVFVRESARQGVADLLDHADLEEMPPPAETPRRMPSQMERALIAAVDAAWSAEQHAERIGYNLRFSSADIRAMAISLNISADQQRRVA